MLMIQYLVFINVAAFAMYGLDKHKAREGRWRIPESTLIGVALIGGGVGAYAGMQTFRHKTKKPMFRFGVPLIVAMHIAVAIICLAV